MAVILIYLLEETALDVLHLGVLRRLVLIPVLMFSGKKKDLFPSSFVFLVYPFLVQCLQSEEACFIAFLRSASWFLYTAALRNLVKEDGTEKYRKLASFYTFLLLVFSFLGKDMFSSNGDWTGIWANRNMTVWLMMSGAVFADMGKRNRLKPGVPLFLFLAFRTHSRMAAVLTGIFLLWKEERRKRMIFFLLLFFAVYPVLKRNGAGVEALDRLFSSGESGGLFRETWLIGIRLFLEKPLLGHGTHTAYYHTFIRNAGGWGWGMHSSWLILLAENGILGGIFLVLFFWDFVLKCRAALQKTKDRREKEVIGTACLICFLSAVNASAESFLFSAGNVMSLAFWLSYFVIEGVICDENPVCDLFTGALPGGPSE